MRRALNRAHGFIVQADDDLAHDRAHHRVQFF